MTADSDELVKRVKVLRNKVEETSVDVVFLKRLNGLYADHKEVLKDYLPKNYAKITAGINS